MNADPFDEEAIFQVARRIASPSARTAYLGQACGADAALRRRVERLLRVCEEEASFLDVPACAATTDRAAAAEAPAERIGPYRLMETIGEGGMGVVYVARQVEPVRRDVALKLIKPGMDSRAVVARFEAERQALALMDHPNIARVLDAGTTEQGRPYFVMELVRGIPITEYCDREQLSVPERLELFVLACRAVQHAHQKGVIHRDLKPSNILVTLHDGVPVPKVIDFGIAKAVGQSLTEKTIYTGFLQLVGTPLYMSPEQADLSGLDVDTRSDIYSLGVLLYELLTGTTPFDPATLRAAALDEMRRIIREEEPARPSTRLSSLGASLSTASARRKADPRRLVASLRGELDWVVMKALEKDRRRRFETANDLAADVMRYLNDQPVEACPPSPLYRFSKFARRNRPTLVAGLLVVLALLIGAGVSAWQAVRATRAERRAEARSQLARKAVDRMYTQVAEKWLSQQAKLTGLQREFLEEALAFYRQFADEQGEDLPAQLEALRARKRVAMIEEALGHDDRAEATYRAMTRELEALSARHPDDPSCGEELAWTLAQLAVVHSRHNRHRDAEDLERRSIRICETLVARAPGNRDYRYRLAVTLHNLGVTCADVGRNTEAEAAFVRAREMLTRLHEEAPDDGEVTAKLALTEDSVGRAWDRSGRHADAEAALRRSVGLYEQLLAVDRGNPGYRSGLAIGLINLNTVSSDRQQINDRDIRIIEILAKLAEEFPDRPRYRELLSISRSNHAITLKELGKLNEAKRVGGEAIATAERLAAEFPSIPDYRAMVADALDLMAVCQYEAGEVERGKQSARRAHEVWLPLMTAFPDRVDYRRKFAEFLTNEAQRRLIAADASRREPAEAVHLARRACEVNPGQELGWKWLGLAEYAAGNWDAAIRAEEKNIAIRAGDGWAFLYLVLASAHWRRGDPEKAREWYAKAASRIAAGGSLADTPPWLVDEASSLLGEAKIVEPRRPAPPGGPPKPAP
ncbi:Serine/threonine-protein kinase PknB [Aquisphaera giovannonii]|uniref:Serine/threonine-protein kinase PknB n=1 Tax=Aquisphaera giovannonii TaxID=406548 RepID=A0A5B9WFY8_9BACT|nr:serine/threonine-protein kinase [Aquisphaera giovannonii]QEH38911.1 Serine/threonine-protein kinase PknB [Aquisphaera giovannonii]